MFDVKGYNLYLWMFQTKGGRSFVYNYLVVPFGPNDQSHA